MAVEYHDEGLRSFTRWIIIPRAVKMRRKMQKTLPIAALKAAAPWWGLIGFWVAVISACFG